MTMCHPGVPQELRGTYLGMASDPIVDHLVSRTKWDATVTEAAKVLHVSRPTLSSLLNAKADLSGDMALRFEKAFGVDMETLMRMQNSFDIAQTRGRAKAIRVDRYHPHPAA